MPSGNMMIAFSFVRVAGVRSTNPRELALCNCQLIKDLLSLSTITHFGLVSVTVFRWINRQQKRGRFRMRICRNGKMNSELCDSMKRACFPPDDRARLAATRHPSLNRSVSIAVMTKVEQTLACLLTDVVIAKIFLQ
jgi:hypothetical protein